MKLKLNDKYISKNFLQIKRLNGNYYYKILNNVLYLNEELFKFKIVSSLLCSFCNSENETLIHLAIKQNLFGLNYKKK